MKSENKRCICCDGDHVECVYQSPRDISVTSLCEILEIKSKNFFCNDCGHLFTDVIGDLDQYYSSDYKILLESEDEDQLYELPNGERIFRTEHQVNTLLSKVEIPAGSRVLDYGCAKSSTLKALLKRGSDITPYVFDVSEMYRKYWDAFVPSENQFVFRIPDEFAGSFDLVTSFFALEHVAHPNEFVQRVLEALKPGGRFYGIVPNTYSNIADFLVVDHVNHFSTNSLRQLFISNGFTEVIIDEQTHRGALIISATRPAGKRVAEAEGENSHGSSEDVGDAKVEVQKMAEFWKAMEQRVTDFEDSLGDKIPAIYGSGFYGNFIFTCLRRPDSIRCFIDQNPHRQKIQLMGKEVVGPESMPEDVGALYVGLNPLHAKTAISQIACWGDRELEFFFP